MRTNRRTGGLPVAVYVTLLLLLPLSWVGYLTTREVERATTTAAAAEIVADAIAVQSAAMDTLVPAHIERIILAEVVMKDFQRSERWDAMVDDGLDVLALRATNEQRLTESLEKLEDVLRATPLDSIADIADDVQRWRAEISVLRSSADRFGVDIERLEALFDEYNALFEQILAATSDGALDSQTASFVDAKLLLSEHRAVVAITATAADEASLLAEGLLRPTSLAYSELMGASIQHQEALSLLGSLDDVPGLLQLADVYDQLDIYSPLVGRAEVSISPERFAEFLTSRLAYLELVERFAPTHSADLATIAIESAEDAEQQRTFDIALLVAFGVASLVVGTVLIVTILRPLTRLRLAAEGISRGSLSAGELPLEGPSDVRKVTRAVNDMTATLSNVNEYMGALGDGTIAGDHLLDSLPGEVGASVRDSVERVSALTTELQASEERLAQEARRDSLTGLLNRFAVLERLDEVLGAAEHAGERVAVVYIDIDGFKNVNDTHGHAVGDEVLREIGHRIVGCARGDDVVARLGGDEFVALLPSCGEVEHAIAFGERVITALEQPHTVGGVLFALSASVGVTIVDRSVAPMRAVEQADAAVYAAKQGGRSRVEVFDADLRDTLEEQAGLELALRQALRAGELRLHLQPMGDIETGRIVGAEALVRWERPGVGLVPPDEFIPVAERSALIIDIGRWVLRTACECVAAWREQDPGCDLRLAVNISGRHLMDGGLVDDVDRAISATGADPTMLEIELTESYVLSDVEGVRGVLEALRSRGVLLSIDDFGTGYSSLTYLQQLPVDAVKIDRAFIARATDDEFDSTIVDAIVSIGRALDLSLVAEGVETDEQLRYITARGVDRAQGYLLARPMPIDEAEAVIFGGASIGAADAPSIGECVRSRGPEIPDPQLPYVAAR